VSPSARFLLRYPISPVGSIFAIGPQYCISISPASLCQMTFLSPKGGRNKSTSSSKASARRFRITIECTNISLLTKLEVLMRSSLSAKESPLIQTVTSISPSFLPIQVSRTPPPTTTISS